MYWNRTTNGIKRDLFAKKRQAQHQRHLLLDWRTFSWHSSSNDTNSLSSDVQLHTSTKIRDPKNTSITGCSNSKWYDLSLVVNLCLLAGIRYPRNSVFTQKLISSSIQQQMALVLRLFISLANRFRFSQLAVRF